MGVNQSLVEVAKPLAAGGEMLRQRMLFLTRSLFGVASIALFSIAATAGGMYFVLEQTSTRVMESRELARLTRNAYVLTIERELLRRASVQGGGRQSTDSPTAREMAKRFELLMDSLDRLASNNVGRAEALADIRTKDKQWMSTAQPVASTTFRELRGDLADLVRDEDERYANRLTGERNMRFFTTMALLAELLVLLILIDVIRRRLESQATEVLRQKDVLEQQAEKLELSNEELAEAILEKESARAEAEEQAEEQRALLTAITEVFFILDKHGRYHKVAPADGEGPTGSGRDVLGKTLHEVMPSDIAALSLTAITRALATRERVEVEYCLDRPNGNTTWFNGTVTPLGDDRVLWVARDVSESRRAAEALKESEARFRNLVEHSPQAVALHAEGRILYVNPACSALLGFVGDERLLGEPLLQFVTRESSPRLVDSLASLGRVGSKSVACLCQFRRLNQARMVDVEVTSVPVIYNGRAGVLSILHDVTERKQLEDQLAHQAFHDPLTNLANRVLFRDRVEHALQRAVRGKSSPSVLFIDLDNFKAVNDGLGHSAGDWLLIEVAARLTNCLRPADTVARLGGDEFAVLIDDEEASADQIAERILQTFSVPFNVQSTDIVVTMSIGIAPLLPHQGADEVLRNADLALYRAKGEGKACAASFEPEMHVAALRRLELEGELRRAIGGEEGSGRLVVHYQPIIRMSTDRLFGFEALVRWQHPERGILEPLDFIALAEETGLIVPLGRWVLDEACRQAVEWQVRYSAMLRGTGISLLVGVNVSGRHLSQPEIVNHVSSSLQSSGLSPSHLVLELTESMLVHDNRATLEKLHSLKSLGVRLSIDDFGTGYSSLAYLERFPVDSLKMDRSFIAGLTAENAKAPLAEAVIGLGRILGLRVVAEGIETKEQLEWLRHLGCGLGQGYHISYPLPAADFERYLKDAAVQSAGTLNGRFQVGRNGGRRTPVSGLAAIV